VFGNDEDGPSCKDDREEIVTVVFAWGLNFKRPF
jgi:hypothetical protein